MAWQGTTGAQVHGCMGARVLSQDRAPRWWQGVTATKCTARLAQANQDKTSQNSEQAYDMAPRTPLAGGDGCWPFALSVGVGCDDCRAGPAAHRASLWALG